MFKPANYDSAEASTFGGGERPPAIPTVMRIISEKEVVSKSRNPMIVLELDIAQGTFAGYFQELSARIEKSAYPRHYRLLTEEQSNYLKGDIKSVEKSNNGFEYKFVDGSLVGKLVGANLQEEEYEKDGEIKTSLKIAFLFPIGDIQKIKPMPKKALVKKPTSSNQFALSQLYNGGLPF